MALLWTACTLISLLIAAFTLHSSICLLRNYIAARRIGVPVRIIPSDHINPLWYLVNQRVVYSVFA